MLRRRRPVVAGPAWHREPQDAAAPRPPNSPPTTRCPTNPGMPDFAQEEPGGLAQTPQEGEADSNKSVESACSYQPIAWLVPISRAKPTHQPSSRMHRPISMIACKQSHTHRLCAASILSITTAISAASAPPLVSSMSDSHARSHIRHATAPHETRHESIHHDRTPLTSIRHTP